MAFADRITPRDALLRAPLAERQNGGTFGFRVSRTLTPRFGAEFNFDYAAALLRAPAAVSSGVQATATSFDRTFEAFLAPFNAALPFSSSVTSSSAINRRSSLWRFRRLPTRAYSSATTPRWTVLPPEVRLRSLLLLTPAIRLAQAILELRQIEAQLVAGPPVRTTIGGMSR